MRQNGAGRHSQKRHRDARHTNISLLFDLQIASGHQHRPCPLSTKGQSDCFQTNHLKKRRTSNSKKGTKVKGQKERRVKVQREEAKRPISHSTTTKEQGVTTQCDTVSRDHRERGPSAKCVATQDWSERRRRREE